MVSPEAMFEEGRQAWPDVEVARDAFGAFVAQRADEGGDLSALHAADLYLACACAGGNRRALAEFEQRYLSEVPMFLSRSGARRAFVDEVRQQLRERLFVEGRITQYSGRGTLTSWLRVVTVRVATDLRRQNKASRQLDEALPAAGADPELGIIKLRYGESFRAALRDVLSGLPAEDRSLLRLHYLDGLNIERIAAVFRVSRATIGRRVVALRRRIMAETRALLHERLSATAAELDSLLRVVRSDLAVSLSVVLRERTK